MRELPYRRLQVWRRSQDLAERILILSEQPPISRQRYFRWQMCNAAMSVPANIAEGNGRSTPLDYASFLDRAYGSLGELDTWLDMAERRGWVNLEKAALLRDEIVQIAAMLNALRNKIRDQRDLRSRR